jgi:replication factor C subunit 1
MNYKVSGDTQELRMSYLPILRERFSTLLTADDGAKTEEAIQLMDEYGLDRDDLFENLDEFKMDKNARALSSLLDSKQKAAFTRAYNAVSHKSQALVDEQGAGKTKRSKSSSNGDLKDPEVVDDDAQLESGDDEDDDDDDAEGRKALENFKKKSKKKGGRKSTGKNVPSKGKSKANK